MSLFRRRMIHAVLLGFLAPWASLAPAQDSDRPIGFPNGFDPSRFVRGNFDPRTFSDPNKFFGEFFGRDDEATKAELEKISISAKEESQLGAEALDAFKKRLVQRKAKLKDRGPEVAYLEKLVATIQPLMRQQKRYRKVHLYYYDIDEAEAYTQPGGHIMISRGMLKTAGCEAAMVCVLGHELAHLDRGHLLRRAKQMKLLQEGMKPSDGFSPEQMFRSFGAMFMQPFGPADELEADTDGITWAYELGYDPRSIEDMYAAIEKPGLRGGDLMPAFFRTHPPSAERRENLAETIARLARDDPKRELYLGRENLRRKVPKGERVFPE